MMIKEVKQISDAHGLEKKDQHQQSQTLYVQNNFFKEMPEKKALIVSMVTVRHSRGHILAWACFSPQHLETLFGCIVPRILF